VTATQVVTTTGCSMANFLALATLVSPGDEVLIERPTYEPLLRVAEHLGASIARVDRPAGNGCRLEVDAVLRAMTPRTRVVVLANLHNPSSQQTADDTLREIGLAAERIGARVIVDEVYRDAVFDDTPGTCVHLGPAFISTSSVTKVYGLSALRCGWILADDAFATRAWRVSDLYGNVQPFAPDWLAARAFAHLDALRTRAQQLLAVNRTFFDDWIRGRNDISAVPTRWGTTVCLRPHAVGVATLCERLRRLEVSVVPGHFFELPEYVRVGLCVETSVLREGLGRLAECLAA
jgi:aspartate/methionine/tyrosine aminotransferase